MSEDSTKVVVRELKNNIASVSVDDLTKLANSAFTRLNSMLNDEEGPFSTDPELALKAYTVIQKSLNDRIECKRRVIDTILRAKTVMDSPPAVPANIVPDADEETEEPDQESVKNSAFA